MSSVAKGVGVGAGVSARGVALTVMVLLLVVALFFIPEIISFQRSIARKGVEPVSAPAVAERAPAEVRVSERKSEGFLDRLMGVFTRNPSVVKEDPAPAAVARRDSTAEPASRNAPRVEEGNYSDLRQQIQTRGVTWETLKSKESLASLKAAQQKALRLAQELPAKHADSLFALYNYASGIGFVINNSKRFTGAPDAYSFLERLDVAVTEAMLRDEVDQGDFNVWANISLGQVFKESRLVRLKSARRFAFNPRLQLTKVKVYSPPNHSLRMRKNPRFYATFIGYVKGLDVAEVQVYRDGHRLRRVKLRKDELNGRQIFGVANQNARSLFTVRVVSKSGEVYQRQYTFFSRAARFPWNPRKGGLFMVPIADGDARVDEFYSVGDNAAQRGSALGYFSRSVGKEFGTF